MIGVTCEPDCATSNVLQYIICMRIYDEYISYAAVLREPRHNIITITYSAYVLHTNDDTLGMPTAKICAQVHDYYE